MSAPFHSLNLFMSFAFKSEQAPSRRSHICDCQSQYINTKLNKIRFINNCGEISIHGNKLSELKSLYKKKHCTKPQPKNCRHKPRLLQLSYLTLPELNNDVPMKSLNVIVMIFKFCFRPCGKDSN